jgi:hypothetical protein
MYNKINEQKVTIKKYVKNGENWDLISENDEIENIKCVLSFCTDMEKLGGIEDYSVDDKNVYILDSISPCKTERIVRTWTNVN